MNAPATLVRATPKPHLIESIKQSNMGWQNALCELIDNSYGDEAGNARNVTIDIWKDILRVTDDGAGVRDMLAMYQLGGSLSTASLTDIGRYGVGAKHACVWIGKRVRVETVREGYLSRCTVDWEAALAAQEWPLVNPVKTNCSLGDDAPSGTMVTVEGFWPHRPVVNVPSLVGHLGRIYASALHDGRTITINDRRKSEHFRYEVQPYTPEGLSDVVTLEVDGCTCQFGILADKAMRHVAGVHYYFGTRWIEQAPDLCGQMLPSRIYGTVRLSADYKAGLSQHKDAVTNRAQLEYKLLPMLSDLIATAREYEKDLSIDRINTRLSQLFSKRIRLAQEGEDPDTTVSRLRKDRHVGPNPNPDPPICTDPRERRPGKFDSKGTPQGGLDIRMDDSLYPHAPMAIVDIAHANIRIRWNANSPLIRSMFEAGECTRTGFSRAYAALLGAVIASKVASLVPNGSDYKGLAKVLKIDKTYFDSKDIEGSVTAWWSSAVTVDLFN